VAIDESAMDDLLVEYLGYEAEKIERKAREFTRQYDGDGDDAW